MENELEEGMEPGMEAGDLWWILGLKGYALESRVVSCN